MLNTVNILNSAILKFHPL